MMIGTRLALIGATTAAVTATGWATHVNAPPAPEVWSPSAAAKYLDQRLDSWSQWPTAKRDHGTWCVSCHTALPFALVRPELRRATNEIATTNERTLIEHVVTRVRAWREVEPYYPDQSVGLPKTSESRGTEAVLNALILARRDAAAGALSTDARLAFTNLWALQFTSGELKGAWAWLNFKLEPWEGEASAYFGAALAAVAVGSAPDGYALTPAIQKNVGALRAYLRTRADSTPLLNRLMALWASSQLDSVLTSDQRRAIIDATFLLQRADGGWSTVSLGNWRRRDGTASDSSSDGYATGLAVFALERAGADASNEHVARGLEWLTRQQDTTGAWRANSLNKARDASSLTGRFMADAATAYASLALLEARRHK